MRTKEEFYSKLRVELESLKDQGLFKTERNISSTQDALITLDDGSEVLYF